MAVSQLSASQIQDQLRQEEEWLQVLEGNLTRSKQLKSSMQQILESFECRLDGLEKTVLPIYEHTAKLQRRQTNVSKCMKEVEATIGFYSVANETDSVIRDTSPHGNLQVYINHMDKLSEAVNFFETNKSSNEEQLDSAKSTFEMGCTSLLNELESLLQRDKVYVQPNSLIEALDHNYLVKQNAISSGDLMGEVTCKSVSKICKWVVAHAKDCIPHMTRLYSTHREANIIALLRNIATNPIPSQLNPALNKITASPKNLRKASTRPGPGAGIRKDSKTLTSPHQNPNKRGDKSSVIDVPSENEVEHKADAISLTLAGLQALIQVEEELMQRIFDDKTCVQSVKMTLVNKPLLYILGNIEGIFSMVQKSILGGAFVNTVSMFKVCRYFLRNNNKLMALFNTAGPEMQSKYVQVAKHADSLCKRGLEGVIETLTSDQDKYVPKDATVHHNTSNTLTYLDSLMEYKESLAGVLADNTKDQVSVSKQFARVLSALGLNLRNKSMMYHDQTVKSLFLLNNLNHILKSVHKSGVLKLVCEQSREVENYYQGEVARYQQAYLHSWTRLCDGLLQVQQNVAGNSTAVPPGSLNDKSRDMVKQAFATFNKEFDVVYQTHAAFSVPDTELALSLKETIRKAVVQVYATFYQTFHCCGFSKNPEKYVKYTPEQLGGVIDRVI